MVQNRKRLQRTRVRKRANTSARQLQRITTRCPLRCRVPRDPPALPRYVDCHQRVQISFAYMPGNNNAGFVSHGNFTYPALYRVKLNDTKDKETGVVQTVKLRMIDIASCLKALVGAGTTCWLEISLLKIMAWGPISTRTVSSSLTVDVGLDSGASTIIDTNSPVARSHLGLTIPHRVWYCSDSTQEVIAFNPDDVDPDLNTKANPRWPLSTQQDFGCMIVTVQYRRSGLA